MECSSMISQDKIDRINLLTKKSQVQGLTPEEREEQALLRTEYLKELRKNFRIIMDNAFSEDTDKINKNYRKRIH